MPKKKKILVLLLCAVAIFQISARSETLASQTSSIPERDLNNPSGGVHSSRGLFVSLIQNPPTLSSREEILKLIGFAKEAKVKILFIQIYRANQAWFSSRVGDSAPYEAALKTVGEDPFAFLIREAHEVGIEVHAWLNMLSLSENENAPILKKYGAEILTRNLEEKKTLADFKIDSQYFLEPGDTRVREELVALVREVVRAYPELDGIQFDYIRYPDSHPRYGYTPINMERFKKTTGLKRIKEGSRAWNDWKRTQVTELLRLLIQSVRSVRPGIRVSATGCMSYVRALQEAFQDWPSWVNSGLVDFVTIMNYSADPSEYENWTGVAKAKVLDLRKLYLGAPAYKLVKTPEIFKTEWQFCEKSGAALCAVFHYGSLLENSALENPLLNKE